VFELSALGITILHRRTKGRLAVPVSEDAPSAYVTAEQIELVMCASDNKVSEENSVALVYNRQTASERWPDDYRRFTLYGPVQDVERRIYTLCA
jgi:hypothetical protein